MSTYLAAWRVVLTLASAIFPVVALSAPPDLTIHYQLVTKFAGAETANGRIVVTIKNVSNHALSDVTVRLADPSRGRIVGKVQDNLELAAGESRRLEGDFVLDVASLAPERPLEWLVVYSDPDGFAHQTVVSSDPPMHATMDADATPVTSAN